MEFALVFGFIIAVVYAIVIFGIVFTGSQLMAWAAEDGARAALRYAPGFDARVSEAERVARRSAEPFEVAFNHEVLAAAACGAGAGEAGVCLRIAVSAPAPVPLAPGMGLIVPREMTGTAQVYLDAAAGAGQEGG